jgi:3',5'-cyclic AMP phosphodiesterase CpdA
MRIFLGILLLVVISVSTLFGQIKQTSRIDLTNKMLSPTEQDFAQAQSENFQVFKILPRGMFDYEKNNLSVRGGGAYYSFTKNSHSYNDTPQIELQNNDLYVGFYGRNYGLISDLGYVLLSAADENIAEIISLWNYKPKQNEREVEEFLKSPKGLEIEGITYKRRIPAIVGHTYILRAISFDEADILVAFKVHRKDTDGSLIIFWKMLKEFDKPTIIRNSASLD